MNFGFRRVAAVTPELRVADCAYNAGRIYELIETAASRKADVAVFPELCMTGYTCGDLFLQRTLPDAALRELIKLAKRTRGLDIAVAVGLPFEYGARLYNAAALLHRGRVLGVVPKTYLPEYGEFCEKRYFSPPPKQNVLVNIDGENVPFGTKLLFCEKNGADFVMAAELGEDLRAAIPPSSYHAAAGAFVLLNLAADSAAAGKAAYRRELVKSQSARQQAAYVYACAGEGESTTDMVFAGHSIVCENGKLLEESEAYGKKILCADVDTQLLSGERRRSRLGGTEQDAADGYGRVYFEPGERNRVLERRVSPAPFVPDGKAELNARCEEILNIQARGLKKRMLYTGCKNAVLNISGGLDSTLALLVTANTFDMLGLDRRAITTLTLPCFGTTGRTYNNALKLMEYLGTEAVEINISEAVTRHFEDIGHDPDVHDLTYENAQARERTQIGMDMASRKNGFLIGTGDLSELALGFATYNGDHMSSYSVNSSVPKTLMRHMIRYIADEKSPEGLRKVLHDIVDTPVSPELLPSADGAAAQITEDIVGPYELHDFFLYYTVRYGFSPEKIRFLASYAFKDAYEDGIISKWLRVFCRRFFAQQYKRSCMPDGPMVGSVSLSPRGAWRMPSDASAEEWLALSGQN